MCEYKIPINLCPYFWTVVLCSLVIPLIVTVTAGIIYGIFLPWCVVVIIAGSLFGYQLYPEVKNFWNVFYIIDNSYSPDDIGHMAEIVFTGEKCPLFSVYGLGIYLWHIVLMIELIWLVALYTKIMFWITGMGVLIALGILIIFLFIKISIKGKDYIFKKETFLLIKEFIKAKKEKVCPRIEFID